MNKYLFRTYTNLLAWTYSLYQIGNAHHEYKITMTALPLGINSMFIVRIILDSADIETTQTFSIIGTIVMLFIWVLIFNIIKTKIPDLDLQIREKSLDGFTQSEKLINLILTFLPFTLTLLLH